MVDTSGMGGMGGASLGLQGIGGIMALIGSFQGAQANRSNLKFQADMAQINATTAERSAQAAMFAGQHEEQRSLLATANLKSSQRASFAASGVDLGEGSAARTLASTDVMGKIDANTIAANAVRTAWGYRTQSVNFQNESLSKRNAADSISPVMAGATSLIGSAGSVAKTWYSLNKAGALDGGSAAGGWDGILSSTRGSGD